VLGLPGWTWFSGGGGGADAPEIAPAHWPEPAPPLKAAALILSSCVHFLLLIHDLVDLMQRCPARVLRPRKTLPVNRLPAIVWRPNPIRLRIES
jgi:hypothetical protein